MSKYQDIINLLLIQKEVHDAIGDKDATRILNDAIKAFREINT